MDEYKAIEHLETMAEVLNDKEWGEAIEIALQALKEKVGYCEDCRIKFEDDLK